MIGSNGSAPACLDGFAKMPSFVWPKLQDCVARGVGPVTTARLPALFFEVLQLWHRGVLPSTCQDQGMDAAAAHALFNTANPFGAFCRDPVPWGPMAGTPALDKALRAAHADVRRLLAGPSADWA